MGKSKRQLKQSHAVSLRAKHAEPAQDVLDLLEDKPESMDLERCVYSHINASIKQSISTQSAVAAISNPEK